MDSNGRLRILYTANLRGRIDLLPRLHTFIRRLREGSDGPRTLLLDLGRSCDDAAWHCAATQGRSMLIALDAMGFDAANVSGQLDPAGHQRLQDNFLNLGLVDETHSWDGGGVMAALSEGSIESAALSILLRPFPMTRVEGRRLNLAEILGGQVGDATLQINHERVTLVESVNHDLPSTALPDPTITAAVDFILSEARRFQHRQSDT
ncbi:MAG: hypothetical protein JNM70_11250 [Anaerolineae bacterium]|nr:hypothetical protein [Anaerolineae bacterium]